MSHYTSSAIFILHGFIRVLARESRQPSTVVCVKNKEMLGCFRIKEVLSSWQEVFTTWWHSLFLTGQIRRPLRWPLHQRWKKPNLLFQVEQRFSRFKCETVLLGSALLSTSCEHSLETQTRSLSGLWDSPFLGCVSWRWGWDLHPAVHCCSLADVFGTWFILATPLSTTIKSASCQHGLLLVWLWFSFVCMLAFFSHGFASHIGFKRETHLS